MGQILKEIFGDTKRIRILEELIENWGEFLTVDEIGRIAETSPKTAYLHINELMDAGLLDSVDNRPKRFKFKEDDKRALALAILESEEYLRKSEISLENIEENKKEIESLPSFLTVYESDDGESFEITSNNQYSSAMAESK
ncbi:MAG: winged helix-turn-helix domain-containing protein [Methanobacterium sp.]|jgi:DNA-binding transcriptional ArsR family regulator